MKKTAFAAALATAAGWALAQAPGAFTPPTFDGLDTDKNGSLSQEEVAKFVATIPLGRFSTPADVANACLYLASDEAEFITGACLEVDGGRCV